MHPVLPGTTITSSVVQHLLSTLRSPTGPALLRLARQRRLAPLAAAPRRGPPPRPGAGVLRAAPVAHVGLH
eukprot:6139501-Alexandrium_andersonii.AAC.1